MYIFLFRHFSTYLLVYIYAGDEFMSIIDGVLINVLHLTMPFFVYLFYVAYKKTFDDKENELVLIITIFTSIYICLKYNVRVISFLPLMSINIPLLISYYKKNNIAIAISSIIIVVYSFLFYGAYLFILIFEYALYGFIYMVLKKKKFNYFLLYFCGLKMVFMFIILFIRVSNINMYFSVLLLVFIFYINSFIIIYFLKKGEDILRIHMQAKEMERDKQIRNTLFRITHEIKNPIAVCKGYLDMFDTSNSKHAEKYIPIIKDEISKTLVLLEDFLSLNRIKIEKDILDINLLLEEVIGSFKLYLKEHKIKLKQSICDNEIYVNGDYNRLREVLVNIFKNSVEAIGDDGVIELWAAIKENNIYIYIKDNGCGISSLDFKKIKEPFFTTKQKGTGLGVALSNEIIERHGGELIYESEYGSYTLVTIVLPILEIT